MGRSLSAYEFSTLILPDKKTHARLCVQFVPFVGVIGVEPLISFTITSDVKQSVEQATVVCELLKGDQSLSPFLSNGAKFDGRPILTSGWTIDIEVQCTPPGVPPDSSGWRKVFTGLVDKVVVQPRAGTVTITLRDKHSRLLREQIQNITTVDGESQWGFPVAAGNIDDALQSVLDQSWNYIYGVDHPDGLEFQDAPSAAISEYWQARTSILEALRSLGVGHTGYDLRGRWDIGGADLYPLTYYLPINGIGSNPHHFAKNHGGLVVYDELVEAVWDVTGVRNRIEVTPADTARVPVVANNLSSQDDYGILFMAVAEDALSGIDDPTKAEALGNRVAEGLGQPPTAATLRLPFTWHLELQDRFSFDPDGYCWDYPAPAGWSDANMLGIHSMVKAWANGEGSVTISGARLNGPAGMREFQSMAVSKAEKEVYVKTFAPVGPGRPHSEWYWVDDVTMPEPD